MLIEESRVFQVTTFGTLHLHQSELDQSQVLLDVIVIADEVDVQLMETMRSLLGAKQAVSSFRPLFGQTGNN
jgi:methionine synthase I (cobalamin-dependent)